MGANNGSQGTRALLVSACSHVRPDQKPMLTVAGVVLMGIGAVWFFQGIGVLPGSFMSGQSRWAVNGCMAAAVGLVLCLWARRR